MTTDRNGNPLDLDGQSYRTDTGLGAWRVTACCGAFPEYNNTGIGPVVLVCKRCYRELPEDYVDAPPRLDPEAPAPVQIAYTVTLPNRKPKPKPNGGTAPSMTRTRGGVS